MQPSLVRRVNASMGVECPQSHMAGSRPGFYSTVAFFSISQQRRRACSRRGGMMASHSSLGEALMLQPRVLAALLAYLEARNASQDQIRRYIRYWRISSRSECALPKLLYLPSKALRPDRAARERRLYATRVPNLQRDVPDIPAIGARLFAFEKCGDVRKQLLATRLAHHTLVLVRSTMRAAFQSTNLTAPLRRLTYSAEPANVALCAGIGPLEIR